MLIILFLDLRVVRLQTWITCKLSVLAAISARVLMMSYRLINEFVFSIEVREINSVLL